MKQIHRLIAAIGLLAMILCLTSASAFAQEATEDRRFPEGVIEVPQGTEIAIDDDAGTVTITNSPVTLTQGDTFIVYLQNLPIGYVANSITEQGESIIISVEKADKAVYGLLDEEGVIELTPDMYEFIPAPNVTYTKAAAASGVTIGGGDGLKYKDGKLSMTVSLGESNATVYISNLSLSHSVSDGNIGISLSGNWGIETTLSMSEDALSELPLGEIRIMGIGKIGIKLSLKQSLSMKCNLSGTFSCGMTATQDGEGTANKGFTVANKSVEGKGSITASMKITAGVDVLVAAADIYVEVGVETQYTAKTTYHEEPNDSVHCDDFRIYMFSTVGVEAKYYSVLSGKMKPLASKKLLETDENTSPFYVVVHFEDGQLVRSCTQGMVVPERHYGGFNASFSGTILSDNRDRIIETSVDLPWDMTIDQDLTLSSGNLNLNGHTLTIEGDLIQAGGTLTIGSGTLIVHGNYRIQSCNNGIYGDSTASLNMNNSAGTINLDGDFILQTNSESHSVNSGTFNIKGDITQINPTEGVSHFNSGTGCNFVLSADRTHTLRFDNAANNSIGWITFLNDVTSQGSVKLGKVDANGHQFVVNGNFTSTHSVDLQDFDPEELDDLGSITITQNRSIQSAVRFEDMILDGYELTVNGDMVLEGNVDLNGGTLTVTGTLYQQSGLMKIGSGKLHIGGNYYITGAGSNHNTKIYKTASAVLQMNDSRDEVRVGGDFVTAATNYIYVNGSNVYNDFSAGTMYIGGDFRQAIGYGSNFNAAASHKVVFNGTGTQTIQFASNSSGFGTVEFQNSDIELKGNYLRGFVLNEDIALTLSTNELNMSGTMNLNGHSLGIDTIAGNVAITNGSIDLAGHNLTINGNLTSSGNLKLNGAALTVNGDMTYDSGNDTADLSGGTLTVTGTLYHQSGIMRIGSGKLHVGGNYYITGSGSNYNTKIYKTASAILQMNDSRDEVRVGGDFVTAATNYIYVNGSNVPNDFSAGTMYIGGDFRQVIGDGSNFSAAASHKVVFNGTGTQTIQFDSTSSHFGTVELMQPVEMYVFNPDQCWITLVMPETPVFGEPNFKLPSALTEIDDFAFEGIAATIVYIPDSCTNIGAYAFRNAAIIQVRIPAGCLIEDTAFDGCEAVQIFGTPGSAAEIFCDTHDHCTFIAE